MGEDFIIKISSIEEYIKEIFEMNDAVSADPLHIAEVLLFRGQCNSAYELAPSVARNRRLEQERNLIEMAKYKLPTVFSNNLAPIDLLALLQHHGIPTRLMDVTSNPLVALYFACSSSDGKEADGEVVVFKDNQYDIANYPVYNAIAESYKFAIGTVTYVKNFYRNVLQQPYFIEQRSSLEFCHTEEDSGANWIIDCCKKIIFIHAQEQSMRQMLQQGQFILFPNKIEKCESGVMFSKMIPSIPKDKEHLEKIITIPFGLKKGILKKLEILGISEGTLFADNTDKVCSQIVKSLG